MIALDFRRFGKKLTLTKCAEVYDDVVKLLSPMAIGLGVKERVSVTPDEIWITQEQRFLFSSGIGNWDTWRNLPIKIKEKV